MTRIVAYCRRKPGLAAIELLEICWTAPAGAAGREFPGGGRWLPRLGAVSVIVVLPAVLRQPAAAHLAAIGRPEAAAPAQSQPADEQEREHADRQRH